MADSPPPPSGPPPVLHRLMDGSSLFLAGFALTSGIACYVFKGPEVFWHTFDEYGRLILAVAPVIIGAVLLGAFLQVLVPPTVIRRSLGQGAGFRGFLIAIGIGTLIPGGPMISMPILMAVIDAGAGLAACVAFYLSWSLLALTRVIQWELPLMGGEFALVRYLACVPLPIVGALIAAWLLRRWRHVPASEP
jgi:uncharacterized membrane protein YraQ (UPF0718 family)